MQVGDSYCFSHESNWGWLLNWMCFHRQNFEQEDSGGHQEGTSGTFLSRKVGRQAQAGLGAFFRNREAALTHSHWQVCERFLQIWAVWKMSDDTQEWFEVSPGSYQQGPGLWNLRMHVFSVSLYLWRWESHALIGFALGRSCIWLLPRGLGNSQPGCCLMATCIRYLYKCHVCFISTHGHPTLRNTQVHESIVCCPMDANPSILLRSVALCGCNPVLGLKRHWLTAFWWARVGRLTSDPWWYLCSWMAETVSLKQEMSRLLCQLHL